LGVEVCNTTYGNNWSGSGKPGVEETEAKTWVSFGPSPQSLIFDITTTD
jgi:hypothetical protein